MDKSDVSDKLSNLLSCTLTEMLESKQFPDGKPDEKQTHGSNEYAHAQDCQGACERLAQRKSVSAVHESLSWSKQTASSQESPVAAPTGIFFSRLREPKPDNGLG